MSSPNFQSVNEDEIIFDADNFTDVIEKEKRKKRKIKIILSIIIGVAILSFSTLFFNILKEETEENTNSKIDSSQTQSSVEEEEVANEYPLLNIYKEAPKVTARQIITETTDTSVIAGDIEMIISDIKMTPIVNKCEVVNPTDFCLSSVTEFDGNTLNIYFMNDVFHSRLFENPSNFMEYEITGSPGSALIGISVTGEEGNVLVVGSSNGSGFMIALPHDMTSEEINELSKSITIK